MPSKASVAFPDAIRESTCVLAAATSADEKLDIASGAGSRRVFRFQPNLLAEACTPSKNRYRYAGSSTGAPPAANESKL